MGKGQASLEISVVLGVMLIIILIFVTVNMDVSGVFLTSASRDKISLALDDIVNSAENVYLQGAGAKSRVFISLPGNIFNSSIQNKTIEFQIYSRFGGEASIYRIVDFNITGVLPNASGNYWVSVESLEGFVNVSVS
jgi:uncharacterized protein (UPF0333 family)